MKKSTSTEITISKLFKKFGLLFGTLETEGVNLKHWQLPIDDPVKRRSLAFFLMASCPQLKANGKSLEQSLRQEAKFAKSILGDDLITIDDIESKTLMRYSPRQKIEALRAMPTDIETLQAIKTEGKILVYGPSKDLSLTALVQKFQKFFHTCPFNGRWYINREERFTYADKVAGSRWLIIDKKVRKESQLNQDERVPNVTELAYAISIYKAVRDEYLFQEESVRSSSVVLDEKRVGVINGIALGKFSFNGMHVKRFTQGAMDSEHLGCISMWR